MKTEVTYESTVVEKLFCGQKFAGVHVRLENTEVVEVALTWFAKTPCVSEWVRHILPGEELGLENLYEAIEEMLKQIEVKKDRKNALCRAGAISPGE